MSKLAIIERFGENYVTKLETAGIDSLESLSEIGVSKRSRIDFCKKTDISEKLILRWVRCADLLRINGIGIEYADLLVSSKVYSIHDLADRNVKKLYCKMYETNKNKNIVKRFPTVKQINDWINKAKILITEELHHQ